MSANIFGYATVTPEEATCAQPATIAVTYHAGQAGFGPGSVVRVQLPDSWHVWSRNSARGVQSDDPLHANFVTACCSAPTATVACHVEGGSAAEFVKSDRTGIDGRVGRYVYVTQVTVTQGELRAGDTVTVIYGDRSAGGPGFPAALHPEGWEQVTVSIEPAGFKPPVILSSSDSPRIRARPAGASEVIAYLPSILEAGKEATLRIVALDAQANLALPTTEITVHIDVLHGDAEVPHTVILPAGQPACTQVPIRAHGGPVLRLRLTTDQGLPAHANPAWVSPSLADARLYWGDLHSHAAHSFDAVGGSPYEYARDVSCLDFFCLTEHCERWPDGTWELLRDNSARFHQPGSFVTLLGYEATFGQPWGHHNVYFRDGDGVVLGADRGGLPELWQALRDQRALTVPHHMGVSFSPESGLPPGPSSPAVHWEHHHEKLRPLAEIYSGHGQSELYAPDHELSYENSGFSTNSSAAGPHYVRDAWEAGLNLGVIASSDNHRGQPGRGEMGLAAVWAPALSREEIFDGLARRHAYATTGARILLDFRINSEPMGSLLPYSANLSFTIRVSGTGPLSAVELLCGTPGCSGSIRAVRRWHPGGADFEAEWETANPGIAPSLWYVRVRQAEPYRGRIPHAWASPIWVGALEEPTG